LPPRTGRGVVERIDRGWAFFCSCSYSGREAILVMHVETLVLPHAYINDSPIRRNGCLLTILGSAAFLAAPEFFPTFPGRLAS
jgi:hypothetical protein